jgi:protein-L-isoaspartate(D-aspartate) O-methyltransferase
MFNIRKNNNSDLDLRISREQMVEIQIFGRGVIDTKVCDAMRKVPRHKFVSDNLKYQAYNDSPLPIGDGQTISQPYMVAIMTELLRLTPECKTLEIGTGCGYQTAVLAELCDKVYSIERIPTLCLKAESILRDLGYKNVYMSIGDGTLGLKKEAPFDRIIVTAGAEKIPDALVEQLHEGGILVIPVGNRLYQTLQIITKKNNEIRISETCQCTFVRLIGEDGYKE